MSGPTIGIQEYAQSLSPLPLIGRIACAIRGAEVTCWVDGVPGGTTERRTDTDHEQRQTGRAGRGPAGVLPNDKIDEHQHEGADDLGDEVPRVLRIAGPVEKVPELGAGLRLGVVEVVPVGEPTQDSTDEGTDELTEQVGDDACRRQPRSPPDARIPNVTAGLRCAPDL